MDIELRNDRIPRNPFDRQFLDMYSGLKKELLSRKFVQRISGLQSLSAEATHTLNTCTQSRCL